MKFKRLAAVVILFSLISLPMGVAAQGEHEGHGGHERHPAIHAAIEALERAKADMKKAAHDFGGHREAALKACDEAIEQLKQALAYDKK